MEYEDCFNVERQRYVVYVDQLPDRHQFNSVVSDALNSERGKQLNHSLLYLNLDQLKIINNTAGYSVGDSIISQLARLLMKRFCTSGAYVASLSGDEFGILLEDCDADRAILIATQLCQYIENFGFKYKGQSYYVTVCIGVASSASGLGSLQGILSAADSALSEAKQNGRNRAQLYHAHDKRQQQRNHEMRWAVEVPQALAENRMFLERQAVVSINDAGDDKRWYEILIRMLDREGNIVMPGEFIPAIERYHQIIAIDIWVVKTVIENLERNPSLIEALGMCLINISGPSMSSSAFLTEISAILQHSDVPAQCICFEITETAAVSNMEQALILMRHLRQLGYRFALDDFGSGLSSFAYLRQLPVDYLKIDSALIQDIANDELSRSMVASIIELGRANNIKIIAEGVESRAVLEILREMNVDYAQGYAISLPTLFTAEVETVRGSSPSTRPDSQCRKDKNHLAFSQV